jgi:hypothetical protein
MDKIQRIAKLVDESKISASDKEKIYNGIIVCEDVTFRFTSLSKNWLRFVKLNYEIEKILNEEYAT